MDAVSESIEAEVRIDAINSVTPIMYRSSASVENPQKHGTSPHFRCWLQAADRRIVIYVRLTSSSGHWDAVFPLLEALRTKPGVLRPAAFDPKQKCVSEP